MMRHPVLPCLLLAALAAGCGGGPAAGPSTAGRAALAPRPVRLVSPEVRRERPAIDLVGNVRADEMVPIAAEIGGRVERVTAEVGDRVTRGKPLASIDRRIYRLRLSQASAQLAAARADLELAEKVLRRKRDLLADRTISQAVFDEAKAQRDLAAARLAAARAAERLARESYRRSLVRAPAGGLVAGRLVTAGQWVETGDVLFQLAQGRRLKVAAKVPEGWATRLAGLKTFEVEAPGAGDRLQAAVYSIEPVVEGASRAFEVVGVIAGRTGLRPGMFVHVHVEAPAEERSLWLPAAAVAISDLPEVMLVENGVVAVRKVRTGRRDDGNVEILDGLAADDRVIADVAGLAPGVAVRVERAAPGPQPAR